MRIASRTRANEIYITKIERNSSVLFINCYLDNSCMYHRFIKKELLKCVRWTQRGSFYFRFKNAAREFAKMFYGY